MTGCPWNRVPLSPSPWCGRRDGRSTRLRLEAGRQLDLIERSLSTDGAIGGVGIGLRLLSCLLVEGLDLSIG